MVSLKSTVINGPQFEKIADYELPQNVSEWNEEILKKFYEDVDYLPKEVAADVVVNNVDENKGYAKGSVVVFYGDKKINYPIIVNNFKLSPFDVFIYDKNGKPEYSYSSLDNVKKALSSEQLATLENFWGKGNPAPGTKPVAGVYPKQSINIHDAAADTMYNPFSKISGWISLAKKEDMQKLAEQLEMNPEVGNAFTDNTGDLVDNIIELSNNERRVVDDDHKSGILDLNNIVDAKRAITAIDSEFIDVDKLTPIKPPSVCEIRAYEYPSMEDFMESGDNMIERFMASKIGKPISGVVLDYMEAGDEDRRFKYAPAGDDEEKNARNERDQIFLSLSGKHYSIFKDWSKTGIGFYGSQCLETKNALEKAISMISDNTTDDFTNHNTQNRYDGSDKVFRAINSMEQGKETNGNEYVTNCWSANMKVIYGAGDAWECMGFRGNYRKYVVNNSNVYVSKEIAIIPANIASVQRVASVEDPVYKMIVGKVNKIYLIPEGAMILNAEMMNRLECGDLMKPGRPIRKIYEEVGIPKVAVCVSASEEGNGYKITGRAFSPLEKIANLEGKILTTNDALYSLRIMGMDKEASSQALKHAVNKYASDSEDKNVLVFGVRGDYVNPMAFKEREKIARVKGLIKKYAYQIRKDLVKEASALQDPEAVDVVLSLNFINEDSIGGYVDNIPEMKRISGELSKMLVASRMGLSDLNESAIKKSIEGISEVVKGLEDVKMAVGNVE